MIASGVVAVVLYLGFIGVHVSPYGSNADASGYLNHAKLIQAGEARIPLNTLAAYEAGWFPYLQSPLGLTLDPTRTHLVPVYPVGYPLQLAAVGALVSLPLATPVLNTLMVLLSGVLLWIFARDWGLPVCGRVAAIAALWASPLFIYNSTQPMSDVCAMVWCLATFCAIQRGNQHHKLGWYIAAGVCLAIAVLVRPTNVLLIFAVVGLTGFKLRPLGGIFAGGVPGGVFFLWYNHHLYGGVTKSGYGDISRFLDWEFFTAGATHFAEGLVLHFSPLIPLLFLGVFFTAKPLRNHLLLWTVPGFIFYACYSFSDDNWWYLRFLLPAAPAIVVGAIIVAHTLLQRVKNAPLKIALSLLGLAGVIGWEIKAIPEQHTLVMKRGEVIYQQTTDWIHQHVEPGAIIIAHQTSGALHYEGVDHFLVRADLVTPADSVVMFAAAEAQQIPIYATLFLHENDSVPPKIGGDWQLLAQFGVIKIYAINPPTTS
ncbi:MAG: hypothetical protein SynsKO_18450 [Synoicihabitans sp.]